MSEERKTLRLDGDGRDVTDLPGLWDEGDSIWHAPLVWSSDRPKVSGYRWVRKNKANPCIIWVEANPANWPENYECTDLIPMPSEPA